MNRAITAVPIPQQQQAQADLDEARQQLVEAEAKLAEEQAAVNAFRMQCRLKLGDLIDETLSLRAERESCLTQLKLHQQDAAMRDDMADPFAPDAEAAGQTVTFAEIALPELATPQQEREAAKRLYRELARRFHPDLAAGTAERAYMTAIMSAVNVAYEQQNVEALHNLAGELDATAVAELDNIKNLKIRKQREQLLKIQRRQRKVQQQYRALRQDNVAKLWRKAQQLEAEGKSWWQAVRQDLQRIIKRTHVDLADLKGQLSQFTTEI
ncbi:J domain-containing protein [Candidatus Leptofilum sp.]|uniref:J domain-containing protein n=1 Tax=Candidatus Leptofilum sp. TaxID=3241576 RepID=UPI003B59C220